jgi:hypothetical protein
MWLSVVVGYILKDLTASIFRVKTEVVGYPTTSLHSITTQKTSTWVFTIVKTSNLTRVQNLQKNGEILQQTCLHQNPHADQTLWGRWAGHLSGYLCCSIPLSLFLLASGIYLQFPTAVQTIWPVHGRNQKLLQLHLTETVPLYSFIFI